MKYDLIIIGTGPAGLSAALYASRGGLKVAVAEKSAPGGRLINTHIVENYLGAGKTTGIELAQRNIEQIKEFGVEIIYGEAEKISTEDDIKITISGKEYSSKYLFISTGTRSKRLDIDNYDELLNNGVSHCLVCDGPLYRGSEIAVIGGGYSATEESLFAKKIFKKIHIFNKFESLKGEEITLESINKSENIFVNNSSELLSIEKEETNLVVKTTTGTVNVSAVFGYMGQLPNTEFLRNLNILDEDGFILVDKETMETGTKNIFAGGDVISKKYRQISTAVSDGTIAALEMINRSNE